MLWQFDSFHSMMLGKCQMISDMRCALKAFSISATQNLLLFLVLLRMQAASQFRNIQCSSCSSVHSSNYSWEILLLERLFLTSLSLLQDRKRHLLSILSALLPWHREVVPRKTTFWLSWHESIIPRIEVNQANLTLMGQRWGLNWGSFFKKIERIWTNYYRLLK